MHKYAQHTNPSTIYPRLRERAANYALALAIGIALAAALLAWWTS